MLVAWGRNDDGECCTGDDGAKTELRPRIVLPVVRASLGNMRVVSVASGESHTLLLTECGDVFACGRAREGQLGLGRELPGGHVSQLRPVVMLRPWQVSSIACGIKHSVAVSVDGKAFEWGLLLPTEDANQEWAYGRHGLGKDFKEDLNERSRRIVAESWSRYLKNDNSVANEEMDAEEAMEFMKLHERRRRPQYEPRRCTGLEGQFVCSAACGFGHSIVAGSDGRLLAAGYNEKGQLGNGSRMPSASFQEVTLPQGMAKQASGSTSASQLDCGLNHSAALLQPDGQVITWGLGVFGQLGLGRADKERCLPGVLQGLGGAAVQVACGDHHTLVLTSKGDVFSFGHRDALGGRSHHERLPERQKLLGTAFGRRVLNLFAGGMGSFALAKEEGLPSEFYAWGYNQRHQLGRGSAGRAIVDARELLQPMPVSLPRLAGAELQAFSAGSYHCVALLSAPSIAVLPPELREPPAWSSALLGALRGSVPYDVEVLTKGKEPLGAHQCIIQARAPKLAAQLRRGDPCVGGGVTSWKLDMRAYTQSCTAALLEYLYCDFCLALPATAAELRPLAEQLSLRRLAAGAASAVETVSADNEGRWIRTPAGQWVRIEGSQAEVADASAADVKSAFAGDLLSLFREVPGGDEQAAGDGDNSVQLVIQEARGEEEAPAVPARVVQVPRSLLYCVEFFRAMLEDGFAESATSGAGGGLHVSADSAEALLLCLKIVATGDASLAPQAVEEALALLVEAHRLDLPEIVSLAERALCSQAGSLGPDELTILARASKLYQTEKLSTFVDAAGAGEEA